MADILACSYEDEEIISIHDSASQAITGMIALGAVYDSTNPQVALIEVNVHMDAVVL